MSQVRPMNPRARYFEEVLAKTGWGLFYNFMLGFTCVSTFANGMATLSLFFALPLAACDTHNDVVDLVLVHCCFNLGRSLSAVIICCISDYHGKKCMIPKSLLVIFSSCFVIAFSHHIYTLYFSAIILGSGLEANFIITKVHFMEILPLCKRGYYSVIPDLFWTFGYFLAATSTYVTNITNTSVVEHQNVDMRLTFWRLLFAISGGLTIALACASALLEPSPRFLLMKRRVITASLILKQFYAINKSKYSETADIYSQDLYSLIDDFHINIYPEATGMLHQMLQMMKVSTRMVKVMFSKRFCCLSIASVLVKVPGFLSLVGMNIFLAKNLYQTTDKFNGSALINTVDIVEVGRNCTVSLNRTISENFMSISVNIFIGQILLVFVIDRIGRKIPSFLGLGVSSVCCFILAYRKNFYVGIAMSSVLSIAYTIVDSALTVAVMESFPTAVRSLAVVFSRFLGHIVASFFYVFFYGTLNGFLMTMAILSLGASILCHFIPEMKHRPMTE